MSEHTPKGESQPELLVQPISVQELIEHPSLSISLSVVAGSHGLHRQIRSPQLQKSGLALVGHFRGTELSRVQLLGATEISYLEKLSRKERHEAVQRYFELELCCVVITSSETIQKPPPEVYDLLVSEAEEGGIPLLLSSAPTSRTVSALHAMLAECLAPKTRVHGVFMDVFEVGLLLLGTSGVGKSELALELVMRGHRLVADDVVECHFRPPGMVFGTATELLQHYLEVRGLGIISIKELFGVTSIRDRKRVDMVVQLVRSDTDDGDRLGLERRFYTILGVEIPALSIPVRPGRDMAAIMEVAARRELQRLAGHGDDFVGRLEDALLGGRINESAVVPPVRRPLTTPAPPLVKPPEPLVNQPLPVRKK